MGAELLFESRQSYHVLRQEGSVEVAPFISMQLALTSGPILYASDAAVVNKSAWSMIIRRRSPGDEVDSSSLGSMQYLAAPGTPGKPRCVIEVNQSPERFAALLDMFKGGHASEITVKVEHLADKNDYSRGWNTALHASIPITSISFEFPVPQNEA
jgi:hypothetical protein